MDVTQPGHVDGSLPPVLHCRLKKELIMKIQM